MTRRNLISLFCFIAFIAMAVASISKDATYKNVSGWLPPDFDPSKCTLLIQQHPIKRQNTRMIDFLKEHYPYSFEVLSRKEIGDSLGKYADPSAYPWALLWKHNNTFRKDFQGNYSGGFNMAGYFFDRTNKKDYPSTGLVNSYAQTGYRPVINGITNHFKGRTN